MKPHVTLAFALRASPGAYAVLLGAGVSLSSGVPSAYSVQEDLILRVAQAEGDGAPGDPFAWYKDRFRKASTYDDLLDALTHTPNERQALLRSYFEPTEEEREQGLKLPTAAHRALARLVASGLVRVILTINFDRLMEAALHEEGVEPTVVTTPSDITGLAPLHTLHCLVVHLHGDYLSPASMLNTAVELGTYPPEANRLLDQIFDEYGLIICGWSATYDGALREALARCPTRRFGTYWADPYTLSDIAEDLRVKRSAAYVQADADTFFGQLADTADALGDIEHEHPATVAAAVASAKRSLAGARLAIPLHDTLRREIDRVEHLPMRDGPWEWASEDANAEHMRRLEQLEAGIEILLALVAATTYWGNEDTDRWWFEDIERFATCPAQGQGGITSLIKLARAPATMILYAAGVAAVAAGRWPLLVRLLTEPRTLGRGDEMQRVSQLLPPEFTLGTTTASRRLHEQLFPLCTEHLTLGTSAYTDAWERFEYLRLISVSDSRKVAPPLGNPHIRAVEVDSYMPFPAQWLKNVIEHQGENHPLLVAGFCGGELDRLNAAKSLCDEAFGSWANGAIWSRVPPDGRAVRVAPSTPWYPDSYM